MSEKKTALELENLGWRARFKKLADALTTIKDSHLGDCPSAVDPLSHAQDHIFRLRKIALAALLEEGLE